MALIAGLRVAPDHVSRRRATPPISRRLLATVTVSLLVLLCTAASALGATGHAFQSQLTEAPPGTKLLGPEAVAVDKAGNVFVADNASGIDVYNSSGAYVTRFGSEVIEGEVTGIAVDEFESSGNIYVANRGGAGGDRIDVFKPNGSGGYTLLSVWSGANTPGLAFTGVTGVAVNSATGRVYVADPALPAVDVFKPKPKGSEEAAEGEYVSALVGKPALGGPNSVTVDSSTGKIYVTDETTSAVEIFNAAGTFESKLTGKATPLKVFGNPMSVGVDETSHDLYVSDGEGRDVNQFGSSGEYLGRLVVANGKNFVEPVGVAVSPAGKVYVADLGAVAVDVFGPNVAVPAVKTTKESKITRTTATLNGTVNPEGVATSYYFEYGESATGELTKRTPTESAGSGSAIVKVNAAVTGLTANGAYIYRLVAENATAPAYGLTEEFGTAEAVTGVETTPVTLITQEGATLNGSLSPEAIATKYHFEYGETTEYGTSTPVEESTSAAPVTPAVVITGLRPGHTYHLRLVATNEFGTNASADAKFTTLGPPQITDQPTTAITFTTATLNAQVNPGGLATKYHFEYGVTTAYGKSVPAPGPEEEIPAGNAPVAKSVPITELTLGTTYHFRVVASSTAGTVNGADQEFTTLPIDSESAREVTPSSAVLLAEINPLNKPTKYHFDYGKTTKYELGAIPVPDATLEAGEGDHQALGHPVGLEAATVYHYRVVASVEGAGTASGPDRMFTTLAAGEGPKLPDGRGWEMVSPSNKHGGLVEPQTGTGGAIQASEDGSALAYVVDGPIVTEPEGNRSPEPQQVIATRGSSTWESREIATPHETAYGLRVGTPNEYQLFSPDLALALVQPFPFGKTQLAEPPLAPPLSQAERGKQEKTIYLRNDAPISPAPSEQQVYNEAAANGAKLAEEHGETAKPGYLPLVTAANTPPLTQFGGRTGFEGSPEFQPNLEFVGATPDLTHVVMRSYETALSPESATPGNLYLSANNKLQLINVLPNGETAVFNHLAEKEPDYGYGYARFGRTTQHAISNDGSRVIWTNDEHTVAGTGHLYLRSMTKGATIQLDKPAEGIAEGATGQARFQAANTTDSKIFFTDTQKLTADSTAAVGKADLYECEVAEVAGKLACTLTDLTVTSNKAESAAVQFNVLGAAEDGSAIYFVANGALAPGAETGANNLYSMHQAAGKWTTALVAKLSSEDKPNWYGQQINILPTLTSRVSPSGRYLAFMSNRRLTGYDNTDVYEEKVAGKTITHADEEVFLYDSAAPAVTCVSCNPSGARPRGVFDTKVSGEGAGLVIDQHGTWNQEPVTGVDHWLAANIPGWTATSVTLAYHQSAYLSDSGRLFFNSADPLVPKAAGVTRTEIINNEKVSVGVSNVYEYEPNGVGNCTKAQGCVALISSGESAKESAFMDASANGNDVFFLTASPIAPQDQDDAFDIYNAHVCTEALPCQESSNTEKTSCRSTEECRPGGPAPTTFVPPPTVNGTGPLVSKAVTTQSSITPPPAPTVTNAQRLAKALKACHKLPKKTKKQKQKRTSCEKQARKRYGPKRAAHKARRASSASSARGK